MGIGCHADKWPSMMRWQFRSTTTPSRTVEVVATRSAVRGLVRDVGTMGDVSDLQQLVESRLREMGDHRGPLSTRQAAARAGGKVSYETLRLIPTGRTSGSIRQGVAEG